MGPERVVVVAGTVIDVVEVVGDMVMLVVDDEVVEAGIVIDVVGSGTTVEVELEDEDDEDVLDGGAYVGSVVEDIVVVSSSRSTKFISGLLTIEVVDVVVAFRVVVAESMLFIAIALSMTLVASARNVIFTKSDL